MNRLIKGMMANDIANETLTYDKMGNFSTLFRTGTSSVMWDALTYTYAGHRNPF